ncbi:MAG: Methionine--tRNA ligase [Firmicutes bacterium ADurb.Bin300]|nr:MAG: Methionine--tRNA ligase [Firmicutes bacterium ADurb.Bin300]
MEKKPYYITTAIAYTSRKPHIGNSYEIVLTDAIARFKRMQGFDVFFLTGTDEHGQKIEECAKQAGCSPNDYVDKIALEIKQICDLLNTTYDKFIRTTDEYHIRAVQNIFKKLYEQGDIYKGEYEGMYCVPCEGFYTQSQLSDGKCPECGSETVPAKEEAYFLRLSRYQKRLEEYIENNPDFIFPESRKKEMLNNFIKPGLQDLCVSRTSFKWGIPVTFDEKHVIYVWVDALSNYITALGFDAGENSDLYRKYWPADVHVIGKDILRFHTIYWPIILMALGEPLPKQVFGHPWLLMGSDKMSKSKGNVIYADDLVNFFGVDAVRYYLLSEMPHAADGSLTYSTLIERFNSELANTLGNLVNRSIAMVNKYFDGTLQAPTGTEPIDEELKKFALSASPDVANLMDTFHISDALEVIFDIAKRSNKYIDETMPWILAKDPDKKDRLGTVLYNLIECIRFTAVLISPFMPETSKEILEQIGCDINTFDSLNEFGAIVPGCKVVSEPKPLFSRLDPEKALAEIEFLQEKEENSPTIEGLAQISIEDFSKIDLRVAEIVDCKPVKRAKKLLELTLNDGTPKPRTVVSGIAPWYSPEQLVGRKVVLVSNLKSAVLCKIRSEGMILAADCSEDDVRVLFVDDMPPGVKIR